MKREDFEFAAEIWWQRAKKLIRYAHSEENPYKRRYKAFVLYLIMYQRVRNCTNVYQFLSRAKKPVLFQSGGQLSGRTLLNEWAKQIHEKGKEFVVTKDLSSITEGLLKDFAQEGITATEVCGKMPFEKLEDILNNLRIKYGK